MIENKVFLQIKLNENKNDFLLQRIKIKTKTLIFMYTSYMYKSRFLKLLFRLKFKPLNVVVDSQI